MAKETYATIYFDKDMTTEKSFGFDSFNENLLGNVMSISIRYDAGEMTDIPDFSELKNLEFTKVEIFNKEGNKIPYFGIYAHVDEINVNYYGPDNIYNVNVSLA